MEQIDPIVSLVRDVLGRDAVGAYVHGSAVSGAFSRTVTSTCSSSRGAARRRREAGAHRSAARYREEKSRPTTDPITTKLRQCNPAPSPDVMRASTTRSDGCAGSWWVSRSW